MAGPLAKVQAQLADPVAGEGGIQPRFIWAPNLRWSATVSPA